MGEQRSPKPQGGGSSPSTPALFPWGWCLLPPGAEYIWSVSPRFYLNASHISRDGITWGPLIASSEADLSEGMRASHHYI